MTAEDTIQRGYMVTIDDSHQSMGTYRISYVPRGPQQVRGVGGAPKQVPEYTLAAKVVGKSIGVEWTNKPPVPDDMLAEFDRDVERRLLLLRQWLGSLAALIKQVRTWLTDLGWSAKQVEKAMQDSEIGYYKAPALLLQEETAKVLLEPVGRSAPGTEGVVDLYLMPGYDDIASLYYYDDRWNLHYMKPKDRTVADVRQAESKPLTKANLRTVLEEMRKHVG